jgi:hypothetical protein
MKRNQVLAATLVFVIAIIGSISYERMRPHSNLTVASDFSGYATSTLTIDGQRISVAIADTPARQELGLGNRTSLADGEGMLFEFTIDREYAFWMKDMHFSIDMVWISASSTIVYMAQNVSPATYPKDFIPTSPARYVLELPANYTVAHGFKTGDSVAF